MDPNISKATTGRERVVTACAESQSTSRFRNRTRFWVVQVAIRVKMQCDKKSLIATTDASKKLNLMVVGGYTDNIVDLCGEDNVDVKRQCLGARALEMWRVVMKGDCDPLVGDIPRIGTKGQIGS